MLNPSPATVKILCPCRLMRNVCLKVFLAQVASGRFRNELFSSLFTCPCPTADSASRHPGRSPSFPPSFLCQVREDESAGERGGDKESNSGSLLSFAVAEGWKDVLRGRDSPTGLPRHTGIPSGGLSSAGSSEFVPAGNTGTTTASLVSVLMLHEKLFSCFLAVSGQFCTKITRL